MNMIEQMADLVAQGVAIKVAPGHWNSELRRQQTAVHLVKAQVNNKEDKLEVSLLGKSVMFTGDTLEEAFAGAYKAATDNGWYRSPEQRLAAEQKQAHDEAAATGIVEPKEENKAGEDK